MMDIIIPTCKKESEITPLLEEIKLTATGNYQIIIASDSLKSASQNRNIGLNKATSDFLIMIDDDIRGLPDGWNETLVSYLKKDNSIAIVSARLMNTVGTPGPMVGNNHNLSPEVIEVDELPTACIAFRRSGIRFDENFRGSGFEDNDFCKQMPGTFIITNAVKVTHINEAKNQGGENWLFNEVYYKAKWMEIIAFYKTFDGEEFAEASIKAIYPHVTNILMLHSGINWLGEKGDNKVKAAIQNFIDKGGDPQQKIIQVDYNSSSQSEQYKFGFEYIRDKIKTKKEWYILILDCDEIWEERDLKRLKFEAIKDKIHNVFTCSLYTYIKQLFYRIDPPEMLHPIVLVAGHKTQSMEGIRGNKLIPFNRRDFPEIFLHHFTYVRKDFEAIKRKFFQTKQAELNPPMREDWLETIWPKIPNVTNFHPSKSYEHSWQQLTVVTKDQLPEAIRGLSFLENKKWKDIVKTIHPDECVEVPDMQVYQQNKEYFIQQGFTEDILREFFPILEQSIWSTFQLFMLARRFKAGGRIVEIGSGQGGSICTMGLGVDRNPAVELISIDKFQPYDEKTHAGWMFNVNRFSYKKFVYNLETRNIKARNIFKWSFEAVGDIEDKSCDMIFIDGNHSYQSVKDDINWYLPKIKEGGIICGHDFHPRFPGVMIAVEEAFGNSFDVMDQSSIWIKL